MKYALISLLTLSCFSSISGCAQVNPDKTAEQVVKETRAVADKLQKALDIADEKSRPFIEAIDLACPEDSSDFCKKANDATKRFGEALDKAQTAVDKYRQFTGDFAPAAAALAEVIKAGEDVIKAAKP